ncbi:MAG: hypothetical protein U1F15_12960 [Burkholderiales bacterium]
MDATIRRADSVTRLSAADAGNVVVTGSHGGLIAAAYVAAAHVRAAVFNDAGRGLDDAGVAGLAALDRVGIAACAVAHTSARIGDADDTLACGVIGVSNAAATACGVVDGMTCRDAVRLLLRAGGPRGDFAAEADARVLFAASDVARAPIWGLDSIGLVEPSDAGAVLVIGSHGALHGGDPASALPVAARAAFFHDAGRGKDDAGVSRLPVLVARGMPAAAVDFRSARIGDARSLWATGVLSVVNRVARERGIAPGMAVRDAAEALR